MSLFFTDASAAPPPTPAPGNIAFDIDGVLANFTRGFTRIANHLFGTPIGDHPSQESWMFEDLPSLDLDKAKCDAVWKVIKDSQNFWANLDPFNPSVMFVIEKIENKIFITNRPGHLPKEQSIAFLERWGVYGPNVIVAADKVPTVKDHNVVAMIDDYEKNCFPIREAVPECYTAMLHTPYNKIHHAKWLAMGGEIVLSVDQFIYNCKQRGLVRWQQ
jgi:hypothetical protein